MTRAVGTPEGGKIMHRYAIEIFYSEEDEGYISVAPELPECSAFGETEEEALKEIKIGIDLWMETVRKKGNKFPKISMNKKTIESSGEGTIMLSHLLME